MLQLCDITLLFFKAQVPYITIAIMIVLGLDLMSLYTVLFRYTAMQSKANAAANNAFSPCPHKASCSVGQTFFYTSTISPYTQG